MKLSTMVAKLTGSKVTVLGGVLVAGAAMTLAAPAAKAQVAFGVQVGTPGYYAAAPAYVAPGYAAYGYGYNGYGYDRGNGYDRHAYWEHRRAEEFRAHEWREHERFERDRAYDRDRGSYGRGWR